MKMRRQLANQVSLRTSSGHFFRIPMGVNFTIHRGTGMGREKKPTGADRIETHNNTRSAFYIPYVNMQF